MPPSVYIESTIPSFVVGNISHILVTAARQFATRRWWSEERHKYRLHVSRLVRQEIAQGNPRLAKERLDLVAGLPQLAIDDSTAAFAQELQDRLNLPEVAEQDAVHLAVASHYRMDYLLTWNLTHIANATVRNAIDRFRARWGTYFPTICTPDELMGVEDNHD